MSTDYNLIIRHTLEIRLEKRFFPFFDIKGKMIDFVLKKIDGQTIRWENNSSRFDIGNKDLSEIFFFGIANYGLQIEGVDNFEVLKSKVDLLYSILDTFGEYNPQSIVRIGTKSSILYHRQGKGFDAITQIFKNRFLTSDSDFEKAVKSKIDDIGFSFDLVHDEGKAKIQTGPMTKLEAMAKVFGDHEKYSTFPKDNGIFFEIDFYRDDKDEIKTLNPKDVVKKNIENLEEIFEGFLSYFFSKSK